MTPPAGKRILVGFEVYTLFELSLQFLKMIFCKGIITCVAIHTSPHITGFQIGRVWIGSITSIMTIGTFKRLMIGFVKKNRVNNAVWTHLPPDYPGAVSRGKRVVVFGMTAQTDIIFFPEKLYIFFLGGLPSCILNGTDH
jgi:hypothetical protein